MENRDASQLNRTGVAMTFGNSTPPDQSAYSSVDDQGPNSRTATSHLFKGIDVHSVWDGTTNHAARVRIDIVVCEGFNVKGNAAHSEILGRVGA